MKHYEITIEETVTDTILIEAHSKAEALEQVEKAYWEGDIVLEPGTLTSVTFTINKENTTHT